jgi:hypothetical protein
LFPAELEEVDNELPAFRLEHARDHLETVVQAQALDIQDTHIRQGSIVT